MNVRLIPAPFRVKPLQVIELCRCQVEAEEKRIAAGLMRERASLLVSAGLGSGLYGSMTFAAWQDRQGVDEKIYKYVESVSLDSPNWLYLHGGYGLGKTHIAVSVLRQLCLDRGWHPMLCRWAEYCSLIQESWKGHGNLYWGSARHATVLLIDDVDKRLSSDWAMGQLYELIEHRYVKQLPTIITANHSLPDLADCLGRRDLAEAIRSRICGAVSMAVKFEGNDYRIFGERC